MERPPILGPLELWELVGSLVPPPPPGSSMGRDVTPPSFLTAKADPPRTRALAPSCELPVEPVRRLQVGGMGGFWGVEVP